MSLNHHFLCIPYKETEKLARFQQLYMLEGKLNRYTTFSDVPKPIDSEADDFAGQFLMDYYLENKHNAVSVHDRFILKYLRNFAAVRTYYLGFIPCMGLNYYGLTIIPLESVQMFSDEIIKLHCRSEFKQLLDLCEEARKKQTCILHCGI